MKSFIFTALVASASAIIHRGYVPSQGIYVTVDRPEDDNMLQWKAGANKIYDADGDGVEDNKHLTHDELDRFYLPNRFFPTEDIYNTRHGNLPGHVQREFYENVQPEPESMDLVKKPWKKW